jgi:small GTP-binding protein
MTLQTNYRAGKFDYSMKMLMVGESGVGKTSLIRTFDDEQFTESFITTIGVDFRCKLLDVGDKKIKLQLWDTAGQERFRSITTAYYRGTHGIVLVYDLTDATSFRQIQTWMLEIQRYIDPNQSEMIMVLIGNKADLKDDRQITAEQGHELALKYGINYYETSAKIPTEGTKTIHDIFQELATQRLTQIEKAESLKKAVIPPSINLSNTNQSATDRMITKCCK